MPPPPWPRVGCECAAGLCNTTAQSGMKKASPFMDWLQLPVPFYRVASWTNGESVLEPLLGVMADWIQGRPSTLSINRTVV